jgi:hypothetical protein
MKKRSADREKSVLEGLRIELGNKFVREVDGVAVGRWYENLTAVRGVSAGHGSEALPRHASHDGKSLNYLVQGDWSRPESC